MCKRLLLLLLLVPAPAIAQPTNATANPLIAPARRTDWSDVGVSGGIPTVNTQCGSQLASSSTAAQINTAMSDCNTAAAGVCCRFVSLDSGTFSLNAALLFKTNVVLRGEGMATILNFTSSSGTTWPYVGSGVMDLTGNFAVLAEATPPVLSVPAGQSKSWIGTNGTSGTYTQGASVVNLGSAPTGMAVGDNVVLWQSNLGNASAPPSVGFFFSAECGTTSAPFNCTPTGGATAWQGAYDDHGTAMEHRAVVTAINADGTCATCAVTIAPPLLSATGTWQTGLSPQLGWQSAATFLHHAGIESLRVQTTSMGTQNCVICIGRAHDVWVKGVGVVPKTTSFHAGGATDYGIIILDSYRVTIRDNWLDTMAGGGYFTTTSYGIATKSAQHSLIENNIFKNPEAPVVLNIATVGCVVGYNYEQYVGDDGQEGGIGHHEVGTMMNLLEGNQFLKAAADVFHGNTMAETFFRNYFEARGFDLQSYHRFYNLIGNVIDATTARKTLATDAMKYDRWADTGFRLGYPQQNASNATVDNVAYDSEVWTTAFLWGNYTSVGGTVFDTAEVPSSDATLPNPVPATQTLPASLYLSAKPTFFGSKPWPLIGPDVTGGNVSGLGGHANTTPAQDCYTAASGSVANFAPTTCYGS